MNLENQFNDHLTYLEAVKQALVNGYKSDEEDSQEQVETPK